MRKILLAGITKDDRKLDVILNLFNQDFSEITCRQVAEVSDLLFNFVPKNNQGGFKTLLEHINAKQSEVYNAFEEIVQGKTWRKTFLKSIETDISFPDFEEPKRTRT